MPRLHVEGLPSGDAGRMLVRLHHEHRSGVERFGIARLSNRANGKSLDVLLLGHERADAIFMPFDIRERLGATKAGELDFSIRRVGWIGKLRWYVSSPDPAVHIPGLIAVIGMALAVIGLGASILPLILR